MEHKITKQKYLIIAVLLILTQIMFISATSSTASSGFNVFFESPTCFDEISEEEANVFTELEEGRAYWREDEAFKDALGDCRRLDGIDKNGQSRTTCCPNGYSCNDNEICAPMIDLSGCEQYDTEETCGEDSGHPGEATGIIESIDTFLDDFPQGCTTNEIFGDEGQCRNFVDCRCRWDPDEGTDGTCKAISNHTVEYLLEDGSSNEDKVWSVQDQASEINAACNDPGAERTGACTFTFTYSGSCLDGDPFVTRSWTANYENSGDSFSDPLGYCDPGSEIIPCERVIRLPFFGLQNIIVAIIIIIIIYYILNKRKRR